MTYISPKPDSNNKSKLLGQHHSSITKKLYSHGTEEAYNNSVMGIQNPVNRLKSGHKELFMAFKNLPTWKIASLKS